MTVKAGAICQYSYAHFLADVPATTEIDCGRVGIVAACEKCAAFYERMGGKRA